MPTAVDICNLALVKLGERRIISLTDNVKAARSLAAIYDLERDNELRAHTWNFATKRVQLAADTTAPKFGYDRSFPLPADYLRLLAVGDFAEGTSLTDYSTLTDDVLSYRIEGRSIVTSLSAPLNLRYVRRATEPNEYDACFIEALASKLAVELCEDITGSSQKRKDASESYSYAIRMAVRANAIEQPPAQLSSSSWMLARLPG